MILITLPHLATVSEFLKYLLYWVWDPDIYFAILTLIWCWSAGVLVIIVPLHDPILAQLNITDYNMCFRDILV